MQTVYLKEEVHMDLRSNVPYPAVNSSLKGGHATHMSFNSKQHWSLCFFSTPTPQKGQQMVSVLFFMLSSWHHFLKRLHMGVHPCEGLDGIDCLIAFVWCFMYWIVSDTGIKYYLQCYFWLTKHKITLIQISYLHRVHIFILFYKQSKTTSMQVIIKLPTVQQLLTPLWEYTQLKPINLMTKECIYLFLNNSPLFACHIGTVKQNLLV